MINTIPRTALQQHIAVLGKTGSGKTYAVRGVVEQLLDGKERVCIIDPTGAWHGLRSSASGKSAGFPVVIFGGAHADLPLSGTHGEALAEIIGTSSTPAIVDTSLMRVGERTRFFADFADALVRKNKGPLHLVIDEAHLFAPQGKVNDPQSGAMLHAANNLVSLGRSRGLRIVLITQRPAKLHKDSLTQVETLVAMRLIAPQDRKAVEEWIKDNADPAKGREIITSLATLKTGQGWVWAPELNVLVRVTFPKIRTFDSGRAPDGTEIVGQVLAPIDREAIAEKLKVVAADALANDPKRLKAQIANLEQTLRVVQSRPPEAADTRAKIEQAAYMRGVQAGVAESRAEIRKDFEIVRVEMHRAVDRVVSIEWPDKPTPAFVPIKTPILTREKPAPRMLNPKRYDRPAPKDANGLGRGGKRRMLIALAQYPEGMGYRKLSILTDMSPRSGTWSNYLGELRANGWIEGRDHLRITDAGLEALGHWEPLPTGEALVAYWRNRLGEGGKRKIFDAVVDAYPDAIAVDELADKAAMSSGSGTWSNYLGELRGLGLIEGRGELRASEDLF